MKKLFGAVCCLVATMVCTTTNADIVGGESIVVDFGGAATQTTLANWNNVFFAGQDNGTDISGVSGETASLSGLTEFTSGTGTTAGITISNVDFVNAGNVIGNASFGPDSDAFSDGLIARDNTTTDDTNPGDVVTIAFSGLSLDPTLEYTLELGIARTGNSVTNFDVNYSVDGQTLTADGSATGGYVTFTGLSTDGAGNLVITADELGDAGVNVGVAALRLTAVATVPEPSSLALLGLGVVGLVVRRRK